jgi:ribokinase
MFTKYDFITIGGATQDISIITNDGVIIDNKKDLLRQKLLAFEYGAKIPVERSEQFFGGGAANAAVCLGRLGFKVGSLVAVGPDQYGSEIIANFKRNKVKTGLVQRVASESTGFSFVVSGKDNEHVVFPVRGANHHLSVNKKVGRQLAKSRWLYLTSLSGDWHKTLAHIFDYAKHAQIAWNPGQIQLEAGINVLAPYLKHTSILILNADEARQLLVSDPKNKKAPKAFYQNIEKMAVALAGYGVSIVLITNGEQGAGVYNGSRFYSFKPKKINKVTNTVGVGDAFGSSFIAGLELYHDINKALQLAGNNAASVVRHHGAQPGLLFKKQIYGKK